MKFGVFPVIVKWVVHIGAGHGCSGVCLASDGGPANVVCVFHQVCRDEFDARTFDKNIFCAKVLVLSGVCQVPFCRIVKIDFPFVIWIIF